MNSPIAPRCAGKGLVAEQNMTFIVAAFAITWVCILAYGIHLFRSRRVAEARLTEAQQTFGGKT
jgi:CcmD family protein